MSSLPIVTGNSTSLERLIRPYGFALTQPAGGRALQQEETSSDPSIPTIKWGCVSNGTALTLAAQGFDFTFVPDPNAPNMNFKEQERQTHTVRVSNPDDPEQFVDVEVIDQIQFNNAVNEAAQYILNNEE